MYLIIINDNTSADLSILNFLEFEISVVREEFFSVHNKTTLYVFFFFFSDLHPPSLPRGFPGGIVVKNPPASTRDTGEAGSIPGSGKFLEEEIATLSSILAWKIP